MPAELQLLRPLWLLALLPLIGALVWLARVRGGMQRWKDIVDAHLAPYVLIGGSGRSRRYPLVMLGLAGVLAIVALAGPAWQKMPAPVFASEAGLVIALDLSRSMNAEDLTPSRIARARFKIEDILNRRDEGQTALIVYAAEAFTVSPLTDDAQTIVSQLPALQPDLMPAQGSRADRAIVRAQELLEQAGQASGDVLLITDGDDGGRAAEAAGALARDGYRLSVLGVGTDEGGPIPGDGNFVKRRDGSIVITALDRDALVELARRGGGIYQDLTPDPGDVARLTGIIDTGQPSEVGDRELEADVWREEGPWLLLPLLALAALAFRRGVLVAVALVVFLPPVPAHAFGLEDLWSRPDQRARRALQAGDAERAAQLFRDPTWKAAAEYRAGDFEQAVEALEGLDGADAHYNRGNALARLGEYEAAIETYERVLELDPAHSDARFNRDLLLEQLQQQSEQQGQSGEEGEDGENDENGQQQGAGNQQGDEGDQGDDQGDQGEAQSQQAGDSGQAGDESQTSALDPDDALPGAEQQADDATASEQATQGQEEPPAGNEPQPALAESGEPLDESEQAVEQWLRRIPDDPGGLLRRKFLYQYNRRQPPEQEQQQW